MNHDMKFMSLLALILITLKLMHYINWPWWEVLLPLWLSWVAQIVFILLVLMRRQIKRNER